MLKGAALLLLALATVAVATQAADLDAGGDLRLRQVFIGNVGLNDKTGTAERIEHTYTQPGTYTLTARSGDRALTGTVVVRPARAPQLTDAVLIDRRRVALRFDEQVQITEPLRGGTRSGRTVTAGELTLDEAGIVITLDGPVASEDRLSVIGVRDRAQRPNAADYRDVAITRPEWPIDPDGLTFAWPNAHDARQVYHPGVGSLVDSELDLRGTAKLDRFGAMVTGDDGITHTVNVAITLQYSMFISVGGSGGGGGGCAAGPRSGESVSILALLALALGTWCVARRRAMAS